MAEPVTLYFTADSENTAVHIATALVREKLVACANVLGSMRSIYEWDGVVQYDNEVAVLLKTTANQTSAVIARITDMHPYDIPCITQWPITGGAEDYLRWVSAQTEGVPQPASD